MLCVRTFPLYNFPPYMTTTLIQYVAILCLAFVHNVLFFQLILKRGYDTLSHPSSLLTDFIVVRQPQAHLSRIPYEF